MFLLSGGEDLVEGRFRLACVFWRGLGVGAGWALLFLNFVGVFG